MRVLFDGYWWHDGPLANRTVQRALITAWQSVFPDDEMIVAVRKQADADDLPASARAERTRLWPQALSNRWELPAIARRTRPDAVIAHNYTPASGRSLVFIHDVMFLEHPEWFSRAERLYFRPMLKWARRAIAVATSTRTEADRMLRLEPALRRPIATGLGVAPGLTGAGRRPAELDGIDEFALTVGRLNVRKNLETVMLGALHSERITPERPLLIVGSEAHSGVASQIPDRVKPLVDDRRIVFLGARPDAELSWLYSHAALTISLSLDEGFGMPAVEAAALGSPLLVSDIPVYRETVGEYASFVSPVDQTAIGTAIDASWGSVPTAAARQRLTERYDWEHAVRSIRTAIA